MSVTLKVHSYVDRSGLVTLTEIERITNVPRPILERMLEEEIVAPAKREDEPMFRPDDVRVIERCLRLHEDLGVNWSGVAIIERLLERLTELQARQSDDPDEPVVDVTF